MSGADVGATTTDHKPTTPQTSWLMGLARRAIGAPAIALAEPDAATQNGDSTLPLPPPRINRRSRRSAANNAPPRVQVGIPSATALEGDTGGELGTGGVEGRTGGEAGRFVYYLGVIDILQRYNHSKAGEARLKSLVYDWREVSSVSPPYYGRRFIEFVERHVD